MDTWSLSFTDKKKCPGLLEQHRGGKKVAHMNHNTKRGGAQVSSLEKLANMDTVYITPAQAAPALGCTPFYISQMAKDEQKRKDLGFPVIRVGNRTKIPRIPFLKVLGWEVKA